MLFLYGPFPACNTFHAWKLAAKTCMYYARVVWGVLVSVIVKASMCYEINVNIIIIEVFIKY